MKTLVRTPLFPAGILLFLLAGAGLAGAQAAGATSSPAPVDETTGVLVVGVEKGGPAEKAGIARGDIILTANGSAVNDARELRDAITAHSAGDTLAIGLRHGDSERTVSLVLGSSGGRAWAGIAPFVDAWSHGRMWAGRFDIPFDGARVVRVTPGGPADTAGIRADDVILSVNGTSLGVRPRLSDIVSGKKIGDTLVLSVRSPGAKARDITVTLAKNPGKDGPWLGIEYTVAVTPPRGPWHWPWSGRSDPRPGAPTL